MCIEGMKGMEFLEGAKGIEGRNGIEGIKGTRVIKSIKGTKGLRFPFVWDRGIMELCVCCISECTRIFITCIFPGCVLGRYFCLVWGDSN